MAKKNKSGHAEVLSRSVKISSFSARVRLDAVHRRGEQPHIESGPWLELTGLTAEPVGNVRGVRISMFPREDAHEVGTARPASVGALIEARPELSFVLVWPAPDFDRVWALALAGQLTHGHLSFTKPYRNRGLVVAASFANEAEE
jgi:hypothetical protein